MLDKVGTMHQFIKRELTSYASSTLDQQADIEPIIFVMQAELRYTKVAIATFYTQPWFGKRIES